MCGKDSLRGGAIRRLDGYPMEPFVEEGEGQVLSIGRKNGLRFDPRVTGEASWLQNLRLGRLPRARPNEDGDSKDSDQNGDAGKPELPGGTRRNFRVSSRQYRALGKPTIKVCRVGINSRALITKNTSDGQVVLFFPPLSSANRGFQVSRNFFPGFQLSVYQVGVWRLHTLISSAAGTVCG